MSMRSAILPLALLAATAFTATAQAQIAAVAIDRKLINTDGHVMPAKNPKPDSVMFLDTSAFPPKVLGSIEAPTTAGGPPATVAVYKDNSMAIVTGGPAQAVTLVDLRGGKPKVADRVKGGVGCAGVSFTPDGKMALVANRGEGTVSVFAIDHMKLRLLDTVSLGDKSVSPSYAAVSPDGKVALVTEDANNAVAVLDIDGQTVTARKGLLTTGVHPYNMDFSPDGSLVAVGNMGRAVGDDDTVSLIDMTANPIRTVNTISVDGVEPEAVMFSPDGKYLIVGLQDGSQMPKDSSFYHDGGQLQIYAVNGHQLKLLDKARIGHWTQGAAFSADGSKIYVQSMREQNIQIFDWDGTTLKDTGQTIDLHGGGAAMQTSY